jgi:hypothetical protein
MDGIHQTEDRDIRRDDVNIVMSLTVPWNADKFFIFCEAVSFLLAPHRSVSEYYLVNDTDLPHLIFPNE